MTLKNSWLIFSANCSNKNEKIQKNCRRKFDLYYSLIGRSALLSQTMLQHMLSDLASASFKIKSLNPATNEERPRNACDWPNMENRDNPVDHKFVRNARQRDHIVHTVHVPKKEVCTKKQACIIWTVILKCVGIFGSWHALHTLCTTG